MERGWGRRAQRRAADGFWVSVCGKLAASFIVRVHPHFNPATPGFPGKEFTTESTAQQSRNQCRGWRMEDGKAPSPPPSPVGRERVFPTWRERVRVCSRILPEMYDSAALHYRKKKLQLCGLCALCGKTPFLLLCIGSLRLRCKPRQLHLCSSVIQDLFHRRVTGKRSPILLSPCGSQGVKNVVFVGKSPRNGVQKIFLKSTCTVPILG
jgi:hypothetical protein